MLGIDTSQMRDDRFYRISDKLLKNQGEIEESLYQIELTVFINSSFFLDRRNIGRPLSRPGRDVPWLFVEAIY